VRAPLPLLLLLAACGRNHASAPAPTTRATASLSAARPLASSTDPGGAGFPLGDGDWAFTAAGQPSLLVPKAQRYEPRLEDGQRAPLVLVLHGLGGSGKLAFDRLGLAELGQRSGWFVLAPDGTMDKRGRRFWNADASCCNFDHASVDDVARLSALLHRMREHSRVDPARVYVVGLSNGGFMAYRLACRIGGSLAAVVSIGGAGPTGPESCLPTDIAFLEVHGDADDIVRYDGGHVFDDPSVPAHLSARRTVRDWGVRLRCEPEPSVLGHHDLSPSLPGEETEALGYTHCENKGEAILWTVHGGHHILSTEPVLAEVWQFLEPQRKTVRRRVIE
jgi:polyhydroxybutyrate depolymerase